MYKHVIAWTIAFWLAAASAWAGLATDQLRQTLSRLIEVINDPDLRTEGRAEERTAALHNVLKTRFDEEAIARKALGKYWDAITEEERREYIQLFIALLERTYFERIDAELEKSGHVSADAILYTEERVKGNSAIVSTELKTSEDGRIPVEYLLSQTDQNWLVTNLRIEGVNISKNYRAQFAEVLSRKPMSELINQLRIKLGKEH